MMEGMNSCIIGLGDLSTTIYYSHLLPALLALFLATYVLIKSKYSGLAVSFFAFTFSFSLWLLGDTVAWGVFGNYHQVYFFWSWLDFINVVFFVLGAYFFGVLVRGSVSIWEKLIFISLCIPAFVLTATGNSVTEFYQPYCEAANNPLLTSYKLFAEWILVGLLFFSAIWAWKKEDGAHRLRLSVVLGAILLFFGVFSGTEYVASTTGVYEINLYGLFVLPVFLVVMVFAITNLQMFRIRYLGTQLLTYVLILMVASQFLFLESSTDTALNVVTLAISIFIGLVLLQNSRRELEGRIKIEKLAKELQTTNEQLSEFMSLATHEIRNPATFIRGSAAMALEGTFGDLKPDIRTTFQRILIRANDIIHLGNQYLNKSKLELDKLTYEFVPTDLGKMVTELANESAASAEQRKITLKTAVPAGEYVVPADTGKIKETIGNLIDNALKYTPAGGSVTLSVRSDTNGVTVAIQDTGAGIPADVIPNLFQKFSRADAAKKNLAGTGLGLYIGRVFVEAHHGRIWVESKGKGQGSTFYVQLPRKQTS